MKTKTLQMTSGLLMVIFWLASLTINAQIQIQGLINENEGAAGWNADGTGPEPAGYGHSTFLYYASTRDYVDYTCAYGAHVTAIADDFPAFAQALAENGFVPENVKIRMGLASLGEDIEGIDWFTFVYESYMNFYPINISLSLNDELLISGLTNYMVFHIGPSTGNEFVCESNYFVPVNASGSSSQKVQNVAAALMQDVGDMEVRLNLNTFGTSQGFSGNGRSGSYFNFSGSIEKGNPEIPFIGLNANHEGFAGWDADGSGPEPEGNGHSDQMYYGASLDYSGIDPDPGAALGHFIEGASGFRNLFLQLAYRGYAISDMKIRLGLISLANDSVGEDWGSNWCNYYNQVSTLVIDNEPILQFMSDTLLLHAITTKWTSESTFSPVKDISQNASENAKFIAQSFLLDLGEHQLTANTTNIQLGNIDFNENGRNGAYWEIIGAKVIAKCGMVNCIEEGDLMGTLKAENSPYLINGNIIVPVGQTLTIEPGTKIAFRGPYHIYVKGGVNAYGTAEEPIIFTHSNPLLLWDGFDYDSTATPNDTSFFKHCIFEYGYGFGSGAYNSGGIFALAYFDKLVVENSTFRYNRVNKAGDYTPSGGAVALWHSSPKFVNCIFHDNEAKYGGAFMIYLNSNPVISNCLFYNNVAEQDGGALEIWSSSNATIINNTFADNVAKNGGAIDIYANSNPTFINTLMWGNRADNQGNQVNLGSLCFPGFYYSNVQGGPDDFGGSTFGGEYVECIDEDPLFMDYGDYPPYYPNYNSPILNAGTPDDSEWYLEEYLPEVDLWNYSRTAFGRIDMGVYEHIAVSVPESTTNANTPLTAYPNPFHYSTNIEFSLEKASWVHVEVYNLIGEKVDIIYQADLPAGKHMLNWQSAGLANGIYFLRLQAENTTTTTKLLKN